MTLTDAPATLLDLIAHSDADSLTDLSKLTPDQKSALFRKLEAAHCVNHAAYGTKGTIVATYARSYHVSQGVINQWAGLYKHKGWRALIDRRANNGTERASLPNVTRQWIQDKILRAQRSDAVAEVHRQILDQWNLWRRTGDPQWAIPGFLTCPADAGRGYPAGLSYENVRRCQPTDYRKKLARQGTIASYRMLPSILQTRVGHKYLQTVFFDDQKYDVQVRVPGFDRPMVPMGFNSIDRLTAYSFQPHIRLRWYDVEESKHRSLTQKEFVWYVITRLCTEGFRTDEVGTTYVQEHGTAKSWSNKKLMTPDGHHSFEDAVKALTGGKVRMDDSGLFNKAAFSELLYGPQSSGNPRKKAPVESFFHIVRTYQQTLIGQTGRNNDEAPEENYGIDKYERSLLKIARELPTRFQEAILSNYLTGVEFGHMALLIYDALNARTAHKLEGWAACNFCEPVWRWEEDPVGFWRPRSELARLPQHLRDHALHQQSQNHLLTDTLPWSPAIAKAACERDPAIKRLRLQDSILLLPIEWAKYVTVRDRHTIHLTDELLPGEDLQYLPELTTPAGRTEYLMPGDEVLCYLNPMMPDQVLVTDCSHAFIGTITRNITTNHDNNALDEMFRQRARLKGALDAPVRRAMQPAADRRAAVRDINSDLIEIARGITVPETFTPAAPKQKPLPSHDPLAADITPEPDFAEDIDPFL